MKNEHIEYLTPRLERIAELTRAFVPIVTELERYTQKHDLPDSELETLAFSIAPDLDKLLEFAHE